MYQTLVSVVFQRVTSGYRPKTIAAYNTHLTTFLQFCELVETPVKDVTPTIAVAFIEYLVMNGLTHGTILSYISFLKQMFKLYNLCYLPFKHEGVKLALRSIAIAC